jgi:membrane protease YdiL (CAAX protease family)
MRSINSEAYLWGSDLRGNLVKADTLRAKLRQNSSDKNVKTAQEFVGSRSHYMARSRFMAGLLGLGIAAVAGKRALAAFDLKGEGKLEDKQQAAQAAVNVKTKEEFKPQTASADKSAHNKKTSTLSDAEPYYGATRQEIPWKKIFVDNLWINAAEVSAVNICKALGIPNGNAIIKNQLDSYAQNYVENPVAAVLKTVCFAPVFEEFLFRLLPSMQAGPKDKAWSVGITAGVLFAYAHNLVPKSLEVDGPQINLPLVDRKILLGSIPITQFISGIYYWHLMREFRFEAPVFAHAMGNAWPSAMILASASHVVEGHKCSKELDRSMKELIAQLGLSGSK